MKRYIILDLDGCLADDRRRLPLIDHSAPDPWEAYHADCENDPLMNHHYASLGRFYDSLVFTARPEAVRAQTLRWLKNVAQIKPKHIFMRPNACRRMSPDLKCSYLKSIFALGILPREIALAIDDREDVLEVYEANNISTVLVTYPKGDS